MCESWDSSIQRSGTTDIRLAFAMLGSEPSVGEPGAPDSSMMETIFTNLAQSFGPGVWWECSRGESNPGRLDWQGH